MEKFSDKTDEQLRNKDALSSYDFAPIKNYLISKELSISQETRESTVSPEAYYQASLRALEELQPYLEFNAEFFDDSFDIGEVWQRLGNKIAPRSAFTEAVNDTLCDISIQELDYHPFEYSNIRRYFDPEDESLPKITWEEYVEEMESNQREVWWQPDDEEWREEALLEVYNPIAYREYMNQKIKEFPGLADCDHIEAIALGTAGGFIDGKLCAISDTEGSLSIFDSNSEHNDFKLSDDEKLILKSAHSAALSGNLWRGSIQLNQTSVEAQLKFLKWAMSAEPNYSHKLDEAIWNLTYELMTVGEEHRLSGFTELFLATEFGDDFGERLINIGSKIEARIFMELSETISRYRKTSQELSQWFGSVDSSLQTAINLAMNERMTETVALIEKIITDGKVNVDISPNSGRKKEHHKDDGKFKTQFTSVEQVLGPLKAHLAGMELSNKIIQDPATVIVETIKPGQEFQIYRLLNAEHGQALIYTRQYGSSRLDYEHEYGNYSGVEARVSVMIDPTDPHRYLSSKDSRGLRVFGIDREGRTLDQEPDDANRTPIAKKGLVSFDTGALSGSKDSLPFKIGSVFAAGNVIRSQELDLQTALNHNTNFFDQELWGLDDNFATFIRSIDKALQEAIALQDKNAVTKFIANLQKNPKKQKKSRWVA